MRRRVVTRALVALLAVTIAAPSGGAQGGVTAQCLEGDDRIEDACQKATDVFNFMSPQIALVVVGGNAALGEGGTLGGFPHFTIGLRGNAMRGSFPDVEQRAPQAGAAVASDFPVSRAVLALPAVDAAIGVFRGFPLGVSHVGGLDLLLSASWLPDYESANRRLRIETPDGPVNVGWGARLGLLEESIVTPAVSVTWLTRNLPTTNLVATTTNDTLAVTGLALHTRAWRVVARKNLLLVSLAAGMGQDRYESEGTLFLSLLEPPSCFPERCRAERVYRFTGGARRTNAFVDVSTSLPFAKLSAEIGMVRGGDAGLATYNGFAGERASDTRFYASLGGRIGL